MIKYFRFSYDFVLWEISYRNLNMLLATMPVYEPGDNDEEDKEPGRPMTEQEELMKFLDL